MQKLRTHIQRLLITLIPVFLFYPLSSQAADDTDFALIGKGLFDECQCGVADPDNNGVGYDNPIAFDINFPLRTTKSKDVTVGVCASAVPQINGLPCIGTANCFGAGACNISVVSIDTVLANQNMGMAPNCAHLIDDPTNDIPQVDPPAFSNSNTSPTTCYCGLNDPDNNDGVPAIPGAGAGRCEARKCVNDDTIPCNGTSDCQSVGGGCGEVSFLDDPANDPMGDEMVGCVNPDGACFCGIGDANSGMPPPAANPDCSHLMDAETGAVACVPADGVLGSSFATGICAAQRNQAYVWGSAYDDIRDLAIVGTGPNIGCGVVGGLLAGAGINVSFGFGGPPSPQTCELGLSTFPNPPLYPLSEGDHRFPEVWVVKDVIGGPPVQMQVDLTTCPFSGFELVKLCGGFRAGGALPEKDVAIVAGPNAQGVGGVTMVLMDTSTPVPTCVQVENFSEFNDIRKFARYNGALYTAVGLTAGQGEVLRCTGCEQDPPTLDFETVGDLNSLGANITVCQNRLMVDTWPNANVIDLNNLPGGGGGDPIDLINEFLGLLEDVGIGTVFHSGVIPPNKGLTPADADNWTPLLTMDQIDPNWVTYQTLGWGGIACNEDSAVVGTMQIPQSSQVAHLVLLEPDLLAGNPPICVGGADAGDLCESDADCTGGECDDSCSCSNSNCNVAVPAADCCVNSTDPQAATFCERNDLAEDNNERPTSVLRLKGFGRLVEDLSIELLYGEQEWPVYATSVLDLILAFTGMTTLEWDTAPNNLAPDGMAPTCGSAGISDDPSGIEPGSSSRNYTWIADNCNGDDILLGTLDLNTLGFPPNFIDTVDGGADLYSFADSNSCAMALTQTGGGNQRLYGFRTGECITFDGMTKYLIGTATIDNTFVPLAFPPPDDPGWELLLLDNFDATIDVVPPYPPPP